MHQHPHLPHARAEGPPPMPDVGIETSGDDQRLRIKLVSSKGQEVLFQVKPSTKLGTVMRAYCTRLNMRMDATRFIFDGNRLNEGLLVSQSGLEDDDVIDVAEEMVGGGAGGAGGAGGSKGASG